MKITFVLNNIQWTTIPTKVASICSFFSPDLVITPTILHTTFNPPFTEVEALGGLTNTPANTQTVPSEWFTQNITPLSPTADIIVFCLATTDVPVNRTSIGIMQGGTPVQCCIFGINETDHAYVNMVDQGNSFELFCKHEISHALYLLEGKSPDNTHLYFYTGVPVGVLTDLKTPPPVAHPTIEKWANAIAKWEGAKPFLNNPGNMGYSSLTASWGAVKGPPKSDGGYFCQFPTYAKGFTALCNFLTLGAQDQLIAYHQARTLEAFSKVYGGNPPQGYIDGIAHELSVLTSVDIATFLS